MGRTVEKRQYVGGEEERGLDKIQKIWRLIGETADIF